MATAEVVVGVQQPGVRRHDAVPVGVGVVAGREIELGPAVAISAAIAYGDEQSIRIFPSQSSVMNANVGSTVRVHHREVEAVLRGDRVPVVQVRPAKGIDAEVQPVAPPPGCRPPFARSRTYGVTKSCSSSALSFTRAPDRRPGARNSSLARCSIQPVAAVSAGPRSAGCT